MIDLQARLSERVRSRRTGLPAYLEAAALAFSHHGVDYATLTQGLKRGILRQPVPDQREHVGDRAPQPDDQDVPASLHAPDERILEEVGEPRLLEGAVRRLVQLRAAP